MRIKHINYHSKLKINYILIAVLNFILNPNLVLCRGTQSLYEDPFDIGGGGATLTWATQEGILINNPSILPYGAKAFRWLGAKINLMAGKDSIDLAKNFASSGGENSENADPEAEGDEDNSSAYVDKLFLSPVHFGLATTFSAIGNNVGLAAFTSSEPDISAWKSGDPESGAGTPVIQLRNETYAGAYASIASRTYWDWLSVGLSYKYLLVSEGIELIDLVDSERVKELKTNSGKITKDFASLSSGMGVDAGSLIFFQGKHVDYRLATTITNAAFTSVSGKIEKSFDPMVSTGLGITFHGEQDAIHLAVDYRDLNNTHGEPLYKHLYAGTKILLRTYLGLAAGLYHGSPSYGVELDFILFRLAAATYTREYTKSPGLDPRKIYIISLNIGTAF